MLASIEYGSGTPVILLHGLLGSKANMAGAARSLSDSCRAIAVDLRNHGESFHHKSMNYRIMAADIGGFMDDCGIEEVLLVGHSMGGKCAMQLALSFPDRVAKLVVVDIAPRLYETPNWTDYLTAMMSVDPAELGSRKEADELLSQAIPSAVYRQFLLSNLINEEGGGFRWRPNLAALLEAREDICAPVSGPPSAIETLFIRGADSDYIEDEDLPIIRDLFPNSTLVTVPDCGHLVHIEARDQFNELLAGFLSGVE